MRGIDDQHSSSDGPRARRADPHGVWHAATQFLFGVIGLTVITVAALELRVGNSPSEGVGPGTVSLLYLIVIVLVSLRGGFIPSTAVILIASFCLNFFVQPLVPSLKMKNPLDIVATATFLLTAWVITGIVSRLREQNALPDGLFEQAPQATALANLRYGV
jgi:K+-sensing histidine kinase KdpD